MTTYYFSTLDTRSHALIYKSGETPRASSGESSEGKKLDAPHKSPSKSNAAFDKKAQLQEANRIKEFESELADIAAKSGVKAILLHKLYPGDQVYTSADLLPLKAKIMDVLQVVKDVVTPEQARYLKDVTVVLDPFNPTYKPKYSKTIFLVGCSSLRIKDMVRIITDSFQYHENSAVSAAKKQLQGFPFVDEKILDKVGGEQQAKMAHEIFDRARGVADDLDVKYANEAQRKFEAGLDVADRKKIAIVAAIARNMLSSLVDIASSGLDARLSYGHFKFDAERPGWLYTKLALGEFSKSDAVATRNLLESIKTNPTILQYSPPGRIYVNYSLLDLKDLERWEKNKTKENYQKIFKKHPNYQNIKKMSDSWGK